MKIQENISLKEYTTFKVGGKARYFAVIKSIKDLKMAIDFSKKNQLPFFVLGGGSNLLISDDGVKGLVLKIEIKGIEFSSSLRENYETRSSVNNFRGNPKNIQVIAGAGENWDDLVKLTVEKNLYGLENLSYIPGTVGASVVQNIGAYGVEIKDVIDWVEVFDIKTGEIKKLSGSACRFGYRDSIFKKSKGKNLIVIKVAYNLKKDGKLKIDYKDIQEHFNCSSSRADFGRNFQQAKLAENSSQNPRRDPEITLHQLRQAVIQIRQNKLPDWEKVGTVGSFFKNPVVTKEQLNNLLKKYPELPYYDCKLPKDQKFKIPLAYILDKILGLKGFKEKGVGLYKNQPLVLINYGGATSVEIKNLAQKIKEEVKDKIEVDIELEVVQWV